MSVLRPPALRAGDRVAVLAPSSPLRESLDDGLDVLRSWELEPVVGAHLDDVHGHLAGTDEARLEDLNGAFRDPAIRAVWAARGGYGITRLLDRIDWAALAEDPIPVVGFSDMTAFHVAAWRRLGLVTIHGPHVVTLARHESEALDHLRRLLTVPDTLGTVPATGQTVASGTGEGRLLGGNLALLCAGIGTPDELDTAGAILLLEDVGEAPYRIDRSLTQLRTAGMLDEVAGIVVGDFVNCDPPVDRPSATVDQVVSERLGDLGVPVVTHLPVGHVADQRALPHGARVRLEAARGALDLLGGAVG